MTEQISKDDLMDTALLGEEAKKFVESDLGQTLIARAKVIKASAQELFGTVDPHDTKAIMKLQNQIAFGDNFEGWLIDLIQTGETAFAVWKQQNDG